MKRGATKAAVLRGLAAGLLCTGAAAFGAGQFAGVAGAEPRPIDDATLEWALNDEANAGTFNGDCNYMSAGRSDGSAATWAATDRGATVLKLTAGGTHEPVADHATRCLDAAGVQVTAFRGHLGQLMRFSNGTGTVDPETGTATISWSGAVTVNYYGGLVPFWIEDPRLEVDSDGTGEITARLGGFASSIDDPTVRTPIDPVEDVVIARLTGIDLGSSAFTTSPLYEGVTYEGDPPQLRVLDGWGSWPAPLVDFHVGTGLASYWYSTGGAADAKKAPSPVTVRWAGATAPTTTTTTTTPTPTTTTTSVPGATTTTVAPSPSSTTTTTAAPAAPTTTTQLGAPDLTGDPTAGGPSGVLGANLSTPSSRSASGGAGLAVTGGSHRGASALGAVLLLGGAVALGLSRQQTRARIR